MMKNIKLHISRIRHGFTLMETLLAVALVGVLLSIFLTVFVPARGMIQNALTKQESDRLVSILRAELSTVRANERATNGKDSAPGQYASSFDKGFYWLLSCNKPSTAIVIFSYRADTSSSPRADGTFPPIPATKSKPGSDTQLVTVACPMDSNLHRNDIKHSVGPVFLVKLTHLEPQSNGTYKLASSPGIINSASAPSKFYSPEDSDLKWGGALFCRADFYLMTPPNPDRYKGRPWSRVGRPVFSSNISIRR